MRTVSSAVALLFLAGCVSPALRNAVDTSPFAGADSVHITGNDFAHTERDTRDIVDPGQVQALYALVSAGSVRWHRNVVDAPLVHWGVEFQRAGKSIGGYAVGTNFVEIGRYIAYLKPEQLAAAEGLLRRPSPSR